MYAYNFLYPFSEKGYTLHWAAAFSFILGGGLPAKTYVVYKVDPVNANNYNYQRNIPHLITFWYAAERGA